MKTLFPILAASAAVLLAGCKRADFHEHTGLQLYSLRAQTLANGFPASLDLAKGFGITEVETGGAMPGMTMEQVRAAADARGLKIVSMHVGYEALTKDVAALIRDAKTLGATYAFCPWIPHTGAFDAAAMQKTADDFNKWGEAFRAAGINFGYHVHGYEFVPGSKAGETLMDDLIRATKPEFVAYEMDVFWVVSGGGDPVKLLEKYPKRWVAMHVKDMRKGASVGLKAADETVVGSGAVDWKAVIRAGEKSGVKYFFIEDETPTPLENIPASLAYLRSLKL